MNSIDGIVIANNIRAERNRANITIQDITDKLGISKPTYIEYEKNAEKIKASTLIELSKLFQCEISSFFIEK